MRLRVAAKLLAILFLFTILLIFAETQVDFVYTRF